MSESSLQAAAMEAACRMATKVFRGDREREAKVADAISYAWQFAQAAPPEATARTLASYAVRRVRSARRFPQSVRSIDGPPTRTAAKAERGDFDVADLARSGEDPALIVQVRLDMRVWWAGLRPREQRVAELLAEGYAGMEVAALLQLSPGRISQIREKLAHGWQAFQ